LSKGGSLPRTFRLDADIIKGLEEEARRQGATVNGLTCRILRKYVKVSAKLEHFGVITLTKSNMVDLINNLDDKIVSSIASKIGAGTSKELMLQLYGSASIRSFKQFLELVVCGYMDWAFYTEEEKDSELEIRIGHNMGQKWSTFLRNYIEAALFEITHKKADFKYVSNYSLIFHIPMK